jgi:acetolactate decarboxylase
MENKLDPQAEHNEDAIYQVALLQSMTLGDYKGTVTIKELTRHGDTGLGTFDGLNGEMILLDGVAYRAAGDGSVEIVSEQETSPFCVVSFMEADATIALKDIEDYEALSRALDRIVAERGKNRFYMIRIDGCFRGMYVRSVPKQAEPYRRLVDVLAQQQTFFHYENIEGTVVGLYCPPYMSYLNAVGWHMHFLSKDKTAGGHVLGLELADAVLTWDDKDSFRLKLPETDRFNGFDLTVDQTEDIEKVEKNK